MVTKSERISVLCASHEKHLILYAFGEFSMNIDFSSKFVLQCFLIISRMTSSLAVCLFSDGTEVLNDYQA